MSEYCKNCYKLQNQYDKVVDQNRQLQKENRELRAALDEIEKYAQENDEMLQGYHNEWANNSVILDIINKAKEGEK